MHDTRRTRVVLGVLLAAALALITIDFRGGTAAPVRDLRDLGSSIFGTAERGVAAAGRFAAGLASGQGSEAKVTALQRQVTRLRAELSLAQLSKRDEAQLHSLLQLAGRGGYRVVAASVIATGPKYENSVTIDAGSKDGIKPDETVLNGNGLVGTVTAVGAHTATVLLLTDAASTVGVRLAGTGEIGAAKGTARNLAGPGTLRLQVFAANAVLKPGQQVVTFGSVGGRPYVPGVPVGVITKVESGPSALIKVALVRPFASVSASAVVGVVIVPPRKNPRDSVLPSPPPTPAPSPTPTATGRSGAAASPTPTSGAGHGTGG